MAKESRGFSATNCMIDAENMLLIETVKDGKLTYDLRQINQ